MKEGLGGVFYLKWGGFLSLRYFFRICDVSRRIHDVSKTYLDGEKDTSQIRKKILYPKIRYEDTNRYVLDTSGYVIRYDVSSDTFRYATKYANDTFPDTALHSLREDTYTIRRTIRTGYIVS